jgi:hypothetical protein
MSTRENISNQLKLNKAIAAWILSALQFLVLSCIVSKVVKKRLKLNATLLIVVLFFVACSNSGLSGRYFNQETNSVLIFHDESAVTWKDAQWGTFNGTYKKVKGGYQIDFLGGLAGAFAEKKGNTLIIDNATFVKQKK